MNSALYLVPQISFFIPEMGQREAFLLSRGPPFYSRAELVKKGGKNRNGRNKTRFVKRNERETFLFEFIPLFEYSK